jgi:hypothetical protein
LDRLREFLDDGQRVLVEQVIGLRPTPYLGFVNGPHPREWLMKA